MIKPDYIFRLTILGGEPLVPQNYAIICNLIRAVKINKPTIKVWLYTGYVYEDLKEKAKQNIDLDDILSVIDYLVDGPFIQEKRDITLAFRGSSNQRILHNINGEYIDETEQFDSQIR